MRAYRAFRECDAALLEINPLVETTDGRVLAATKTGYTSSTQPLTQLLVRDTSGNWSAHRISTVAECPGRMTVVQSGCDTIAGPGTRSPTPSRLRS